MLLSKSWRMAFVMVVVFAFGCGEKPEGQTDEPEASEQVGAPSEAVTASTPRQKKKGAAIDSLYSADADVFISARPAEILDSPVVQAIVEGVQALPFLQFGEQKSIDEMVEAEFGLPASVLERLVVTLNAETQNGVGIFVHSAPIKDAIWTKIREEGGEEHLAVRQHQGVEYFANPDQPDGPTFAFLRDDLTIVGTEEEVKSAISRFKSGGKSELSARLASLVAKAPESASLIVAGIPNEEMLRNSPVGAEAKDVEEFVLALSASDKLDLWLSIAATSEAAANRFRQDGAAQMSQMKSQFGPMFQMPELAPVKNALDSVKFGGQGREFTVTAIIESGVIDAAPMLMGMFMGGMGGPGMQGGPADFDVDFDDFDFDM